MAYVKSTPNQGLVYWKHGHTRVEVYSHSGYMGDKGDKKSTSEYCTYVKDKKQNMVSRSSAQAEYRSMTQTTCEIIWLGSLLIEFDFSVEVSMSMHCSRSNIYCKQSSIPRAYETH